MQERFDQIVGADRVFARNDTVIGHSREGRPVHGFRLGTGNVRVSLIGGCHADEPVGPRFLRHLAAYLTALPPDDNMLSRYEWWIVPHVNPDGEERNRAWDDEDETSFDIAAYLTHVVREPPGDDIEFGFPKTAADRAARPENRAVFDWWRSAGGPFMLHASLHGMAFAAGPWFLIEPAWSTCCDHLKARCSKRVAELGYRMHDVERRGEKGFVRLQRGFTTRPDSRSMQQHFLQIGDEPTARLFRPSSMESVRSLGGDPLTLVSEMPLFIVPGVGETLGPPDPIAENWRVKIESWREGLRRDTRPEEVQAEAQAAGLRAMPVRDQMDLQWTFIVAGLEQVALGKGK